MTSNSRMSGIRKRPVFVKRRAAALLASVSMSVFGTLLLTFGGGRTAHAQTTTILPVRLKLGILTPQEGGARDIAGSPLFAGEVDVALPAPGVTRTYVSAGYQYRSGHGGTLQVIPLTVSKIFTPPNPASGLTGTPYAGVGVGLYQMHAKGGSDDGSDNASRIGGFGVVGYQTPQGYLVEAKYQYVTGSVHGVRPTGVLFLIGKRL